MTCYLNKIQWVLSGTNITLRFEMMMQQSVTEFIFDFMQHTFNSLDGLYMDEEFILIDTIKISIEESECSGS